MNTLQQVIKQRMDELKKKLANAKETDLHYYNPWVPEIISHNQETVVAILEAVKEWHKNYFLKNHDHHSDESDCTDKDFPYVNSLQMEKDFTFFVDSTLQDIKNNK